MKKVLSCLILLLAFFSLAAGELRPLSGGVCLRYDDNQKPEVWRAMMKTFAAHGGHFSASLNMLDFDDGYFPIVRELAAAGHEIVTFRIGVIRFHNDISLIIFVRAV